MPRAPTTAQVHLGDLQWGKPHHDSPCGRIVSNWKRDGESLTMEVTIPPNATATVYVPAKNETDVKEEGMPAGNAMGLKFLRMENGAAVFELGSGSFEFAGRHGKEKQQRNR